MQMRIGGRLTEQRKPTVLLGVLLAVFALVAVAVVAALRQSSAPVGVASAVSLADATASAAPVGDSPSPAAPPPRDVRVSVAVSGDLLPHLPIVQRARDLAGGDGYDFRPMLRPLAPLVRSADLAFCHLEAPLQPGVPSGYPRFRAPPELAHAIKATGWDACSTASNHTLDLGQSGVRSTLRALERAGVAHTGSFRSASAQRTPLLLEVRGVRVAFLSYTATTNGLPLPRPWSVNLAEPRRILADARRARRRGADAVVVNLHWGTEYQHQPDAAQWRLARALTRSSAITALVGQHAHVVQPIRKVQGRWVVFGSGNLLSNQTAACCTPATQDGMVVVLDLRIRGDRDDVSRIRYTPTWVRHPDYSVLPVGRALPRAAGNRPALRASWKRTVAVVGRGPRLRPVPRQLP